MIRFCVLSITFALLLSSNLNAQNSDGDKPLRHLVFFDFVEGIDDSSVSDIVDTFNGLPSKISSITDFQSGKNDSPEGLDDGFTHAFAVSFKDQAGLKAYGPDPAHQDLVKKLKGKTDSVFVFDYLGSKDAKVDSASAGVKHFVFFKFKDDADPQGVLAVEEAFAALTSKIDTITGFEWGKRVGGTKGDGFTHAFVVAFADDAGRAEYLPHPEHQAFVGVLKPVLDKVRVIDFTNP
ncbi:MAG: Dabb family protein [Planctomycetota bacterium]